LNDDPGLGIVRRGRSMKPPEFCGRVAKRFPYGMIELADAAKACSNRNFSDRDSRLDDQISRNENAMGSRDFQWRGTQMLLKKAAKVARADPHTFGKLLKIPAIEGSLGDQL
jgi:hypothetical protein